MLPIEQAGESLHVAIALFVISGELMSKGRHPSVAALAAPLAGQSLH